MTMPLHNTHPSAKNSTNKVTPVIAPGIDFMGTTSLEVTEAGGTATFEIILRIAPRYNVILTLKISDSTEGLFKLTTSTGEIKAGGTLQLVFTPDNWNTPHSVIIMGVDDKLTDGDIPFYISTSVASEDLRYDGTYSSMPPPPNIFVTTIDDDQFDQKFGDTDGITTADVLIGGNGPSDLYGLDGSDELHGSDGNDRLYGGHDNDTLYGQADNDLLQGDRGNDKLDGGMGDDILDGGVGADTLLGGIGNDTLDGGSGSDEMDGGSGADVYYADEVGDAIHDSGTDAVIDTVYLMTHIAGTAGFQLGEGIESGVLSFVAGQGKLVGNATSNHLIGNTDNNTLVGAAGSDTLAGGDGADVLDGGNGVDALNGGNGADQLIGGDGSDTYYVDHSGDQVIETNTSTGGTDLILSSLSAYTLTDHVENGRINTTNAANLSGNSGNNVLYAGAGNNVLNGGSGTDTVHYGYASAAVTVNLSTTTAQATGGSGSDTLTAIESLSGSKYHDKLTGSSGNNKLDGGVGNDTLSGGSGNDTLLGGEGLDRLVGGAGRDSLTGGAGNDLFDFNALSELGLGSTARDVITDFIAGQDKIDLSTIDANSALAGDQAFKFVTSFTATAGQVRYAGGILYLNTDSDTAAEFEIQLTGSIPTSLTGANLVL